MSTTIRNFWIILTTLFVLTIAWLHLSRVDVTTQAIGVTGPEGDATQIGSIITGQVVAVHFKEGDSVNKDDKLITVWPGIGYEQYNIVSTIDGKIQRLNFANPGAVVEKGDPVAIIIPAGQECIVKAKLLVKDRGYVYVGDRVKVKLANQDQLRFDAIDGVVESISPDVVENREGTYYEVRINLAKQEFEGHGNKYDLVAGIQVQAFIVTGSRSILDYLLQPFTGVSHALQER